MRRISQRKLRDQEKTGKFYDHIVQPATPEETRFRHGHWAARRALVRQRLTETACNTFQMNRFDECGSGCRVEWSETLQRRRIRASYCRSRHCEPCARAKGNRIAANLRDRLAEQLQLHTQDRSPKFRFVTLTLKHTRENLAHQIRRLYSSFKKLRAHPVWKKTQSGGCFMLEVKHSATGWHPHLHIITQGKFLKQHELSIAWLSVTGDSTIVHITQLREPKDAVHYVVKYVSKGTNKEVWDDPNLSQEWITASKSVRTCATFGNWRGFKLCQVKTTATDWTFEANLTDLVHRARGGEQHAWQVLQTLNASQEALEIE